jgi:PAS domain S-box-containing protein
MTVDSTDLSASGKAETAFASRVLAASPAITYVYDLRERRSIYQNRGLDELLGYPPSTETSGSAWSHRMHADDQALFAAHRERMERLKPGEEITWEYRLQAPDGSWRWFLSRDALLQADENGTAHLIVGTAADITALKEMQRDKDLLLEEARHRTKNFTAVMLSLAKQSAPRPGEDARAAYDRFVGRLRVILEAGNLVMSTAGRTTTLHAVLDTSLGVLLPDKSRVRLDGPDLLLSERVAGGLMLMTHELTTNAIKYGALSRPGGAVHAEWRVLEGARRGRFVWKELGGPPISPPKSTGFGTRLLTTALSDNAIAFDYRPDGLNCRFEFEVLDPA